MLRRLRKKLGFRVNVCNKQLVVLRLFAAYWKANTSLQLPICWWGVGNFSCLEGGHVIRRICKHFRPCLPVFAHVCTVFLVAFRKPLVKFPIRGVPFRLLWLGHFKGSFIGHDLFELNMDNLMFFWPCIMNWLYINYQLDAMIIIYSKILISSTCFEPQVLIFRRIQLYTCSIWYCHSLWELVVACRYTAWVRRRECRGE